MQKRKITHKIDSSILDNIHVGIFRTVPHVEGRFVEVNEALVKMLGYSSKQDFLRHITPADFYANAHSKQPLITLLLRTGMVRNKEIILQKKDGTTFYARVTATVVKDKKGQIKWFDGLVEDITPFRHQQERFRHIFQHSPVAIWEEDLSALAKLINKLQKRKIKNIPGYIRRHPNEAIDVFRKIKIVDVNKAALELYGAKNKRELIHHFGKAFKTKELPRIIVEEFAVLAGGRKLFETELRTKTLNRKTYDVFLRVSVPSGYEKTFSRVIVTLENITERKRLERHLKKMALEDGLTKLLNIRAITNRLGEELIRSKRYSLELSCLMIDVDHFKFINDNFGHQKGNLVLKRVAQVILNCVRRSDIVGRYGGDEFLVLLPQTDEKNAAVVAFRIKKVLSFMKFPFLQKKNFSLTVSIGVSNYPKIDAQHYKDLIAAADKAMYQAKAQGRNCVIMG